MKNYVVYFDSGTTNTRAYLLDRSFQIRHSAKKAVGSKDSAIAGTNRILAKGMKVLYDELLTAAGLTDADISAIYASGMVSSVYGLLEVPHLPLPLTAADLAQHICPCREDAFFHRDILLVPGLKTVGEDVSLVNNMRGEEIEIAGAMDALDGRVRDVVFLLPGSHTHAAYVQGEQITGILSTFTGELFYALRKDTILAPVLSSTGQELDGEMVRLGLENLERYGFNRALYICHTMRTFGEGSPRQWLSYGEGVILGGVRRALEYYCQHFWTRCHTVALVSNQLMYRLFSILLADSAYIDTVLWLPTESQNYAVAGLKRLVSLAEGRS